MKEVIKERINFDSFTDDILTEGLKVILVMVGIFTLDFWKKK